MCSYFSVKEMNVKVVYEINHIRTAEMKSLMKNDPRVVNAIDLFTDTAALLN